MGQSQQPKGRDAATARELSPKELSESELGSVAGGVFIDGNGNKKGPSKPGVITTKDVSGAPTLPRDS